jgi:hypothetical protein
MAPHGPRPTGSHVASASSLELARVRTILLTRRASDSDDGNDATRVARSNRGLAAGATPPRERRSRAARGRAHGAKARDRAAIVAAIIDRAVSE